MSDQTNRIFKIGATTIVEDDTMRQLSVDEIRQVLQRTYPEVTHATMRETTLEDGTVVIHYQAVAGRKG